MARSGQQKRGKDWIPGLNGISVFRCFGKEDTEEARFFSRQGRDQDDKEWKGFPIPAASQGTSPTFGGIKMTEGVGIQPERVESSK